MKIIYLKLIKLGVDDSTSHFEELRITVINQMVLIIAIGTFIAGTASILRGDPDFYNSYIMMFSALLAYFFIHKGWHLTARFYAAYLYPALVLYMIYIYGTGIKLGYALFAFIMASVLLFDEGWSRRVHVIYIIILQIFGFYFSSFIVPINAENIAFFDSFIAVGIAMICCYILLKTYFNESQRHYKRQVMLINQLEEKNEKLQALNGQNNAKSDLLAILAHDLKSPAISFKNISKKLQFLINKKEYERLIELSRAYERDSNLMFYSLDNLLNWVISQKEGIRASEDYIRLSEFIDTIISAQNYFTKDRKIEIINTVSPLLVFLSDKDILNIILSNILNNAIKFSKDYGQVIIEASHLSGIVTISIFDNGIGIEKDKLNALLSKSNLHKLEEIRSKGHGLGLKTCMFLINKLEGKIQIESKKDQWTRVEVIFPAKSILPLQDVKKGEPSSEVA